VTQPARSPDLNVLDLGAWNSLQAIVPVVKYEKDETEKIYTRLIKAVLRAWEEWAAAEKLEKLFNTLYEVCRVIQRFKGGSRFTLPHYTRKIYKELTDTQQLFDSIPLRPVDLAPPYIWYNRFLANKNLPHDPVTFLNPIKICHV
jgi:hypothetical protein